jgi:hypothetical protein
MQTIVQVICRGPGSLREAISQDKKLDDYRLKLVHSKRQNRSPGWAKVKSSSGDPGALNFDWDASSKILTCRAVTKRKKKPYNVVGDFVAYLMARHEKRLVTIVVSRQK